jgi:hypothetical protein
MGIGTKASVGHQDITGAQVRMESDHLGKIMGAQGGRHALYYQPSPCMKQRQQGRNREATPGEFFAGLAKRLLQGGSIGHGKTRTIDPKGTMAQPASLIEGMVLQSVAHSAEQLPAFCAMKENGHWGSKGAQVHSCKRYRPS